MTVTDTATGFSKETVHIVMPIYGWHKAKRGTVKKYTGILSKEFGDLSDKELEEIRR